MIHYADMKRIEKATPLMILTSPDHHERFLFFRDPFNKNACRVLRQILVIYPEYKKWRTTRDLESSEIAVQQFAGGIITTKEKGNLKYLEYVDRGYIKTKTDLSHMHDDIEEMA